MDPLFAQDLTARANGIDAVLAARGAAGRAGTAELYLIGGAVRDLVRGAQPLDIDLSVDGDPHALAVALAASDAPATAEAAAIVDGTRSGTAHSAELGQAPDAPAPETRFGTVTIYSAGVRYDIARTRTEHYPRPGALPEVEPAPIDRDLLRRDFTVNAIALGLAGPRTGQVLGAPGAIDDLTAGRLAVLHDASFEDDPTRLLRLARYHARLGFEITPQTRALAQQAIAGGVLQTVSGTRTGNELRLLANEPDPVAAFTAASDLGLPWSLDPDVARRALSALTADGRPDLLVLAVVFAGSREHTPEGSAPASELDRLGFRAADRDAIIEGATQATELAERLRRARSGSEIARTIGTAAIETVALASSQGAPDQSQRWLETLRHLRIEITGADLVNHGVPVGPPVGRGLQAATDALQDGTATNRDSQLAVALKAAQ